MLASRTVVDPLTSAGPRILTGASIKRVTIAFYPPATGTYSVSNEPGAAFGSGLVLVQGNTPVRLWLDYDGDCVQREWYVTYSGLFAPAVWIETLATCAEDQLRYLGKEVDKLTALYPGEVQGGRYAARSVRNANPGSGQRYG